MSESDTVLRVDLIWPYPATELTEFYQRSPRDFDVPGGVRITRGKDSICRNPDGSVGAFESSFLELLFGLAEAVDRAAEFGPHKINSGWPDYFELYVVDAGERGVWVSALGNDFKLLAPRDEWMGGLASALEQVRSKLREVLPELASDTVWGPWIRDGIPPQKRYSSPGGV